MNDITTNKLMALGQAHLVLAETEVNWTPETVADLLLECAAAEANPEAALLAAKLIVAHHLEIHEESQPAYSARAHRENA